MNIYKAYITGNMALWKSTLDSLENRPGKSSAEILELINYQYGYTGWCIDQKQIEEAENYINKTEKLIRHLEQKEYDLSMLFAYKAALIGFKIGISPYKAPFIGMKSQEYAEISMGLNAKNPMACIQLGNICYYKPKWFGGSKKEAIQHYQKALMLMETNPTDLLNNWNYLNLLAIIIHAQMELGQYSIAAHYCEKALALEPSFDWVKNILYPQTLKELKDE
jgi:tetratricopeptide (TPR) repeat protein